MGQTLISTRRITGSTVSSHSTEFDTVSIAENALLPGIRGSLFKSTGDPLEIVYKLPDGPQLITHAAIAGLNAGSWHRNLLAESNDMVLWTLDGLSSYVSRGNPATPLDPEGGLRTFSIRPSNIPHSATHKAMYFDLSNKSTTLGGQFTASVYAKKSGTNIRIAIADSSTDDAWARFDLTGAGSVINSGVNGTVFPSVDSTAIEQVGSNGWYRCSITATAGAVGTLRVRVGILNPSDTDDTDHTMEFTAGSYFFGAQIELSDTMSDFVETGLLRVPGAVFQLSLGDTSAADDYESGLVSVAREGGYDFTDWAFAHAHIETGLTLGYEYGKVEIWDADSEYVSLGRVIVDDPITGALVPYRGVHGMSFTEEIDRDETSARSPVPDIKVRRRNLSYSIQLLTESQRTKYRRMAAQENREVFFTLGDPVRLGRTSCYGVAAYEPLRRVNGLWRGGIRIIEHG